MKVRGPLVLAAALLASALPGTLPAAGAKEIAVLPVPQNGHLDHLLFSADGTRLVASGWVSEGDGRSIPQQVSHVIVWDVARQQQVCTTEPIPAGENMAGFSLGSGVSSGPRPFWVSPDAQTLIRGGETQIWLWDGATGKRKGVVRLKDILNDSYTYTAAALSPDGASLAIAQAEWFGKPLRTGTVATAYRVGDIAIWDVKTGKVRSALPGSVVPGKLGEIDEARKSPSFVQALAFSPDGTQLAAVGAGEGAARGRIRLWDLKTARVTATLKPPEKFPALAGRSEVPLEWLADGKTLVLRWGTTLETWDTSTGEHKDAFSLTGLPVGQPIPGARPRLGPPPAARRPAGDGKADAAPTEIEGQSALSADGTRLAVQMVHVNPKAKPPTTASEVVVWDVPARRPLGAVQVEVSPEIVKDLRQALERASGQGVNRLYWTYRGYMAPIALSPDGKLLAIAGAPGPVNRLTKGPVRVYEVSKLTMLARPKPAPAPAGPPAELIAARETYEHAVARARDGLLARFDERINRLKGDITAGKGVTPLTIFRVKEEKERFETEGILPWSAAMRGPGGSYLAALADARAEVFAVYRGREMPPELRELVNDQVLARWRHRPGNGTITLYANGHLNQPASENTWSYKKGVLTLRWKNAKAPGGYWVDTCHVAADGLSYAGANQHKTKVSGMLIK